MKFAICRINTIFAEDYFRFFVPISAPGPFYYVVRLVRSASSVGGF